MKTTKLTKAEIEEVKEGIKVYLERLVNDRLSEIIEQRLGSRK